MERCTLGNFDSQGGGLFLEGADGGTATLINSNVYENEALGNVCVLF